ncbi:15327_t:CDS:2 [Funneliformis geosporum]|uniref:1588_t:CDS:1 n=1 Tax=Funneliformis geosporum TaxID=1117311 RepID=A0A9W4SKP3_9GLOM|nr:1588_t:CDS:2 [Funneliformis geosporum]CAI2188386.1 15327_t:CDS:2 [Funneliformis geosporum]
MGNSNSSNNHTTLHPSQAHYSPSCKHIQRYLINDGWCKKCTMKSVNSGHRGLDKLILRTQKKSTSWTDPFLEWIPFEHFRDVCKIDEGGFGIVYRATWTQGSRQERSRDGKIKSQRTRTGPITVTLKCIKNSQEMSDDYLKRLKSYYKTSLVQSRKRMQQLLKFYGISKDPTTGEYIIVTQYTEHGSLRTLFYSDFPSFRWTEKSWWLCDIASNLLTLHKEGIVHGNIHSGNILQIGELTRETTSTLADTGLNFPASTLNYNIERDVYGVLPYLAPEVIMGNALSKESDVFSIGILMIEMSTGIPPFSHRPHDEQLALEICQGLRPELAQGTPKVYADLARKCCSTDPSSRPTTKDLLYIFNSWWSIMNSDDPDNLQVRNSFLKADLLIPDIMEKRNSIVKDEQAIFKSRLIQFQDVFEKRNTNYSLQSEPTNSVKFSLLDLNLPNITIGFD